METINLLSSQEAANVLHVTRQAIFYLVKKGILKPAENIISKHKFFIEEDVYKYSVTRNRK